MPDTVTQLQHSLDELATQMFAALRYITEHHSNAQIPGQQYLGPQGRDHDPQLNPTALPNGDTKPANPEQQPSSDDPPPLAQTVQESLRVADDPKVFEEALREMARDLVRKEKEMEALVEAMPGKERSKEQQKDRMRELEAELRVVEGELREAGAVKDDLLNRVEGAIWKCNRY